jgi:hypothetical protein
VFAITPPPPSTTPISDLLTKLKMPNWKPVKVAGVDLVTLAAMLEHSKLNMVLRYAHPIEQHQAAAMQKIQQRMAAR